MKQIVAYALIMLAVALLPRGLAAHILAMVNYESKTEAALKAAGMTDHGARKEGIAVVDVDPKSGTFGKILVDISIPNDTIGHHIFLNRDMKKAYITALGKGLLYVMDMKKLDYRLKKLSVPACVVGEDVIFNGDNNRWYLTCMGSGIIIVGDVKTDAIVQTIKLPKLNPHGIAMNDSIDRILVTNTIQPDLKNPGETITAVEASTGKVLEIYKLSEKPSPSGEAPVEILFVPGVNPPVAYITNMFGNAVWTATWNPASKGFDVAKAHDFAGSGSNVPLEIYFNGKGRMYVTTANPGHFHLFDISENAAKPKLLKTVKMAAGAHHVGFTKDFSLAFVQNAFINLKGMDDGAILVFDMKTEKIIASIDTFKNKGLNPNSIILLPKWNHLAGH